MECGAPMTTYAVDFDGTLYDGPFVAVDNVDSPPMAGAIAWLAAKLAAGDTIIIHTCRLTPWYEGGKFKTAHEEPGMIIVAIKEWLYQHGLQYQLLTRLQFWTHAGKPGADYYIDDKAIRFTAWSKIAL